MSKLDEFLDIICKDKFLKEHRNILRMFLNKYLKVFNKLNEEEIRRLSKEFFSLYQKYSYETSRILDEFSKILENRENIPFYVNYQIFDEIKKILKKLKEKKHLAKDQNLFINNISLAEKILDRAILEENILKKELLLRKLEVLIAHLYLQTVEEEKKEKLKKIFLKYMKDYPWHFEKKEKTLKSFVKKFVLKELGFRYPRISLYGSLYFFHKK